jgi:hypothetical protein
VKTERVVAVTALVLLMGFAAGCIPTGQPPFRMVQLCLNDAKGLSDFTAILQSIARSERMEFGDRSAQTEAELRAVGKASGGLKAPAPVVNMGIRGERGIGVGASNLGTPGYQVVLGVSEGRPPEEAHRFADRVVARLSEHRRVEPVPGGQGAFPLKGCGGTSERLSAP